MIQTNEVEETLSTPSTWLKKQLRTTAASVISTPAADAVVEIHATVDNAVGSAANIAVAKFSVAELYGYSEAPWIDFLNAVGELESKSRSLLALALDSIEFENAAVLVLQDIVQLRRYLHVSALHDELIAALETLPRGTNGELTTDKVKALISVFSRLKDQIVLHDGVLDEVFDTLESSGFDLDLPMSFSALDADFS